MSCLASMDRNVYDVCALFVDCDASWVVCACCHGPIELLFRV